MQRPARSAQVKLSSALIFAMLLAGDLGTSSAATATFYELPDALSPTLEAPDGAVLRVPKRAGPLADQTLVQLAAKASNVDTAIKDAHSKNKLTAAQLQALVEARNLMVDELQVGQEILTKTSGGKFPANNKQVAESYIDAIGRGLTAPRGRDNVRTNIEYARAALVQVSLQYQSYADAAAKRDMWATYTPRQILRVGTYVFEVRALTDGGGSCRERVAVLSDPTERQICGAFRP
jgi:hypothetical protein